MARYLFTMYLTQKYSSSISVLTLALCAMACQAGAQADPQSTPVQTIQTDLSADHSLKLEIQDSIRKGARWLASHQDEAGHWSDPNHPALTAFPLFALLNDPTRSGSQADFRTITDKAFRFLTSKIQADGGIYTEGVGLANYNTSASIMALTAANNAQFTPVIQSARSFIVRGQFDFGKKGEVDTPLDGGIGYGNSYPHSDLANTVAAIEALRYSEVHRGEIAEAGVNDLNWEAAIQFISNCQNLKGANSAEWVSEDPVNKGGFVYFPGNTKSEQMSLPSGRVALRSYGSISYAGLLSLAYARLSADDDRVKAVVDWLKSNYTLEENPGMDQQGLFYYFQTMAKALTAARIQAIDVEGRGLVNWRRELFLKLQQLQSLDGSWSNPTARWMEKDPVLVTSYCLIALELIEQSF
ncbi:MAG: terpene cyclase/mutase family protein [Verrucomicrobia bacterium]|nr:terpene cyclase/mutase family protein [Verrucomicrobiota bacterium]